LKDAAEGLKAFTLKASKVTEGYKEGRNAITIHRSLQEIRMNIIQKESIVICAVGPVQERNFLWL
jgi:hypothetical protein